jgi:hypothetical protein
MGQNRNAQTQTYDEAEKAYGDWLHLSYDIHSFRTWILFTGLPTTTADVGNGCQVLPSPRSGRDYVEEVRSALTSGEIEESSDLHNRLVGKFEEYDEACAALGEAKERYKTAHANYRGLNQFFYAPGGHVHSSLACPTCNKKGSFTPLNLLTDFTGLTEEEAVAQHGAVLCTVCFPTAPVKH